jgi:hypothetical protein
MGHFNVGEVVTCIPMISRSAAPGDYKILRRGYGRALPARIDNVAKAEDRIAD